MAIEFVTYTISKKEANDIYNVCDTIKEINIKLLQKLNLDTSIWNLIATNANDSTDTYETLSRFLLISYRRIIASVNEVTNWPGDTQEAIIFTKYWDIRKALPCVDTNGTIIPGRSINIIDLVSAIEILKKNIY